MAAGRSTDTSVKFYNRLHGVTRRNTTFFNFIAVKLSNTTTDTGNKQSEGDVSSLSPCDFHLIPKMKEPLRGIRFRTVPQILQAVDRSIRTINITGAAKGILRLPQSWQRVVHNAGDYTEKQ